MLAVDAAGQVMLVRQYRAPAGASLLEVPAGSIDDGEDVDAAVQRELQEGIGMRAGSLRRLGGFDEGQLANQDYELNYRLRRAGGRVVLVPDVSFAYVPRSTPRALAKQFFRYGYYKARTMAKHPASIRPSHLAPALALLGVTSLAIGCPWTSWCVWALGVCAGGFGAGTFATEWCGKVVEKAALVHAALDVGVTFFGVFLTPVFFYVIQGIGKETAGLPQVLLDAHPDRTLRIPMRAAAVRSINLSTAVGVVSPTRSGMACCINNTFRQVGIATGIAVLGALVERAI